MAIDPRIKSAGNLATEAFQYLNKLQKGEKRILKTGQDFIDCHIDGLLPSDTILYAAGSGVGKTKLLFDTLDKILSPEINPNAEKFVSLEYQLEMKFLNKILRDTNNLTKKKKAEILKSEFSDEEKEIIKRYYEGLQDNRRFVCEETITAEDFFLMTEGFCEEHRDKEGIIVSIDHLLLLKKKAPNEDTLEILTSYINVLRKKFSNIYFILLSQFNRSSLAVIKDRDNAMTPTAGMIYGSSHFEFLSSYIVCIVDAFKLGVNEYLKVNSERYDWLEDYMTGEDSKGKVSFNTLGNMFYFVLKTRESDTPYKNLFIRKQDLTVDQVEKLKQTVDVESIRVNAPIFEKPNFDFKEKPLPTPSLNEAFGVINKSTENDSPF